jgi:hypothetical protein
MQASHTSGPSKTPRSALVTDEYPVNGHPDVSLTDIVRRAIRAYIVAQNQDREQS